MTTQIDTSLYPIRKNDKIFCKIRQKKFRTYSGYAIVVIGSHITETYIGGTVYVFNTKGNLKYTALTFYDIEELIENLGQDTMRNITEQKLRKSKPELFI